MNQKLGIFILLLLLASCTIQKHKGEKIVEKTFFPTYAALNEEFDEVGINYTQPLAESYLGETSKDLYINDTIQFRSEDYQKVIAVSTDSLSMLLRTCKNCVKADSYQSRYSRDVQNLPDEVLESRYKLSRFIDLKDSIDNVLDDIFILQRKSLRNNYAGDYDKLDQYRHLFMGLKEEIHKEYLYMRKIYIEDIQKLEWLATNYKTLFDPNKKYYYERFDAIPVNEDNPFEIDFDKIKKD